MMRLMLAVALVGCIATVPASAEPVISAGGHALQADRAGQIIDILVTGGDSIDGLNFYLSVGDGVNHGGPGPLVTGIDLSGPGTIFHGCGLLYEQTGGLGTQNAWAGLAIDFGVPSAKAEGVLARATLDTTGVALDEYPLWLVGVGETSLVAPDGWPIDTTVLQPGSLAVPEPAAAPLLLAAALVLAAFASFRRRG